MASEFAVRMSYLLIAVLLVVGGVLGVLKML